MRTNARRLCPVCEEENLAWARYCRACSTSLEGANTALSRSPMRIPRSLVLAVLLCALAFAIFWTIFPGNTAGVHYAKGRELNVLWHKFYGNYGQEWIVGEVRNDTGKTLNHVMVIGEFFTDDQREVASGTAAISPDRLPPGGHGIFKVTTPYREEIDKSWFHFQTGDGQQVPFNRP
jgi:hypothetical protein